MKAHQIFLFRFFLGFSLIPCLGCRNEHETNYPSLNILPEVVDLGRTETGKEHTISGQFKLVNKGTADLIVLGSKTSCGCTIPVNVPERIPPQAEQTVNFQVKPRNETGTHTSSISFITNDPARPVKNVEIRWIEKSAIFFDINNLDFILEDLSLTIKRRVTVFVSPSIDLKDLRLKSNCPGLNLSIMQSSHESIDQFAERRVVIEASLSPVTLRPEGTAEIRVQTVSGNYFSNLPVTWMYNAPVSVNPKSFFHSNIAPLQSVSCQILLHSRNVKNIVIESILIDGRPADYTLVDLPNNHFSQKLEFRVKTGDKPGVEEHLVTIKLADHPVPFEIPAIIHVK